MTHGNLHFSYVEFLVFTSLLNLILSIRHKAERGIADAVWVTSPCFVALVGALREEVLGRVYWQMYDTIRSDTDLEENP